LPSGLKKATLTARVRLNTSFLGMVDGFTSFLTLSSFQPGSIIILVVFQTDKTELEGMVAELETEE
jgi:hypothetical protein